MLNASFRRCASAIGALGSLLSSVLAAPPALAQSAEPVGFQGPACCC